jgi:hypothetical protein
MLSVWPQILPSFRLHIQFFIFTFHSSSLLFVLPASPYLRFVILVMSILDKDDDVVPIALMATHIEIF